MSEQPAGTGRDRLVAHVEQCEECHVAAPALDRVATLLDTSTAEVDATAMSQRTLTRLRPELERRAALAFWQRFAGRVLLSLLPLPAVLAYDAYVLRVAYEFASALLPATVAAYLVLSYAAFLLLLFALTYAAIPFLVVRDAKQHPLAPT